MKGSLSHVLAPSNEADVEIVARRLEQMAGRRTQTSEVALVRR